MPAGDSGLPVEHGRRADDLLALKRPSTDVSKWPNAAVRQAVRDVRSKPRSGLRPSSPLVDTGRLTPSFLRSTPAAPPARAQGGASRPRRYPPGRRRVGAASAAGQLRRHPTHRRDPSLDPWMRSDEPEAITVR